MKIFIVTDMEGVCGVINHDDWVVPGARYYENGKKLLTMEVNAAVEGFFSAGADEIHVFDGHGHGGIDLSLLDSRVYLIRGHKTPWPFTLDHTFDAIAWIGQHAKAGTEYAHIPHTGWFNVLDYTINGISVGEFGQLAMCGSYLGVHSIFAAGDEAFTKEAKRLIDGIETVAVKRGLSSNSGAEYDCEGYRNLNLAAIHMHPEKACMLIRGGAQKALNRFTKDKQSFSLIDLKAPYEKKVRYRTDKDIPTYCTYAEHPDDLIEMMNMPEIKINLII
jgi:D-aminopeptidase